MARSISSNYSIRSDPATEKLAIYPGLGVGTMHFRHAQPNQTRANGMCALRAGVRRSFRHTSEIPFREPFSDNLTYRPRFSDGPERHHRRGLRVFRQIGRFAFAGLKSAGFAPPPEAACGDVGAIMIRGGGGIRCRGASRCC